MAVIFSPVTEEVLKGPFKPIPRGVFFLIQSNSQISDQDAATSTQVEEYLLQNDFTVVRANRTRRTKDYLEKIISLIRGCGFCLSITSKDTPSETLANIFFEIGIAVLLGKPTILIKRGKMKLPSDFVRTEWVEHSKGKEKQFRKDFREALDGVLEMSEYFHDLGELAYEANEPDLDLAFERFRQSTLITGREDSLEKIREILETLKSVQTDNMYLTTPHKETQEAIRQFLKLYPT